MNKYFWLAVIILSSCSTPSINNLNVNTDIVGKIEFPDLNLDNAISKNNLNTKAIYTDISANATVSIFHPKENKAYPERNFYSNQVISTTQSDSVGSFTIHNDNFNPAINRVYILEVMKRLNSNNLTLRTFIKWNGASWESMTTPDLKINTKTTALTIISNTSNIDELQTIGKINVSTGTSVVSNIGISPDIITSDTVLSVSNLVTQSLAENKDPFSSIINDGFYHIDRTFEIGKLKQTGSCVNCSFKGENMPKSLKDVNLYGADLSGQYLVEINFFNTNLQGANLSDSILSNRDLRVIANKNLSNTNMSNAVLDGINLSGSAGNGNLFNLAFANLKNSDLTYASLMFTSLLYSDLSGADLRWADLSNAFLGATNLTGADLRDTNFNNAYLGTTDFTGADLRGADFNGAFVDHANFTGADLTDAIWKDGKLCEENSIGTCNK